LQTGEFLLGAEMVQDQAVTLKQQGVYFYNQGDLVGAETALGQALTMNPRDADILVSLGGSVSSRSATAKP